MIQSIDEQFAEFAHKKLKNKTKFEFSRKASSKREAGKFPQLTSPRSLRQNDVKQKLMTVFINDPI